MESCFPAEKMPGLIETASHVFSDFLPGSSCFRNDPVRDLESVKHPGPDLNAGVDSGIDSFLVNCSRVIEKHLIFAYVYQHRRKSGHVSFLLQQVEKPKTLKHPSSRS